MSRNITFDVIARDRATSTLEHVASQTERNAGRISGSLNKATGGIGRGFSKLGMVVGGEVGEMFFRVSEGLDQVGAHASSMGKKLAVGGAALSGLGFALQKMGAGDKQALDQLGQAITDSGHNFEDYRDEIEKTAKGMAKYGHSAKDAEEAMQKMVQATGDPKKALESMGLVADYAAAKHISLAEAAGILARVYNGATKPLKEFGIVMNNGKSAAAGYTKAIKAHDVAVTALAKAQANLNNVETLIHAKAKLSIADQQRLAAAQAAVNAASSKGPTVAQVNAVAKAKQKLADIEAEYAGKAKLSVAQQIRLRDARASLADAEGRLGAGSADKLAKAKQHLADLEAVLYGKTQLSTAEQQRLAKAHEAVTQAQAKLKASTVAMTEAQKGAKDASKGNEDALTQLSQKTSGQASAAVDNITGKLRVWRAELENSAASIGQKFGPAITSVGTLLFIGGTALGAFRDHQAKVAEQAVKTAAAQEAASARVVAANAAVEFSDGELAAAEAMVAEAANGSVAEQTAAITRLEEAKAAQVTANAEANDAIIAADEASGKASSFALGPLGIVVGLLAAAGGAFALFGHHAKDQVKPTDDLTDAIKRDNLALGTNTRAWVINDLQKKGAFDTAAKLGISQKTLTDAVMGDTKALHQVADANDRATAAIKNYEDHGVKPAGISSNHLFLAQQDLKKAIGDTTEALQVNTQAANNEAAANGQLTSVQLAAVAADAKRLTSLGANAKQANALATAYEQMPADKRTKVTVEDYASTKLAAIKKALDAIGTSSINYYIAANANGHQQKASGGDVHDGLVTVGERGPELMEKRGSTVKVLSNQQSRTYLGQQRPNITINQTIVRPAGENSQVSLVEAQRQAAYAFRAL